MVLLLKTTEIHSSYFLKIFHCLSVKKKKKITPLQKNTLLAGDVHTSVTMDRHVQLTCAYSLDSSCNRALTRSAGPTCICLLTWGLVVQSSGFPTTINVWQCPKYTSKTTTEQNTVISSNIMVWRFCVKAQFRDSFGQFAPNFSENCAFPQNLHTRKLDKITVFCAVTVLNIRLYSRKEMNITLMWGYQSILKECVRKLSVIFQIYGNLQGPSYLTKVVKYFGSEFLTLR